MVKSQNTENVSAKKENVSAKKENKSTLHKNYSEITVEMTDGTKFKTKSTYFGDLLKLDVDPKTHPAWTKEANYINTKATEVAKFNNKFKGLSFLSKAKK
jgi:large subunit ribosomal protein L31